MLTDLNIPFDSSSPSNDMEFQAWLDNNSRGKGKRKERADSEYSEQVRFVSWCRSHEDERLHLIYSHLNGMITYYGAAVKAKRSGAISGLPDLFLPVAVLPYHGLYIEMKAIGGRLTQAQSRVIQSLSKEGYRCVVTFGCDAAIIAVQEYLTGSV